MDARQRQHPKGKQRSRSFHRGKGEAQRWDSIVWPDLGVKVAYAGAPVGLHQPGGARRKGEAL
jgi:hypothetical protein